MHHGDNDFRRSLKGDRNSFSSLRISPDGSRRRDVLDRGETGSWSRPPWEGCEGRWYFRKRVEEVDDLRERQFSLCRFTKSLTRSFTSTEPRFGPRWWITGHWNLGNKLVKGIDVLSLLFPWMEYSGYNISNFDEVCPGSWTILYVVYDPGEFRREDGTVEDDSESIYSQVVVSEGVGKSDRIEEDNVSGCGKHSDLFYYYIY